MKRSMKLLLPLLTLCAVLLAGQIPAAAAVHTFDGEYLEIATRDDILVMTQDTSKYDPVWAEVGVTKPKDEINNFKSMGVVASFYDPSTKTTVNFISKQTETSGEQFTFAGKSEAEIVQFMEGVISPSEGVTIDVSGAGLSVEGIPFFKMKVAMDKEDGSARELILGTIVNARLLQFDVYSEGTDEVDDAFLREIVESIHFTRFLTLEEYEKLVNQGMIMLAVIIGVIIGIIVLLIVLARRRNKKEQKRADRISERMRQFRAGRQSGSIPDEPAFLAVNTQYTDAVTDEFMLYTMWIKDIVKYVIWGVIFVLFVFFMFRYDSIVYAIITIALAVVILYNVYNRGEKQKARLKKDYDTARKPVIVAKFYSEYFTISGVSTLTEYVYCQITDVRRYKKYLYLYTAPDRAAILDTEAMNCDVKEFEEKMRSKIIK